MYAHFVRHAAVACLLGLAATVAQAQDAAAPFIGYWSFASPGGGACWLGIDREDGKLSGSLLWEGGRPVPIANVYVSGGSLHFVRIDGRYVYVSYPDLDQVKAWPVSAVADGDTLTCTMTVANGAGDGFDEVTLVANRIPDVPPAPDLSKVKYGKPIELIKKDSLDGWSLMGTNVNNGWHVDGDTLINDAHKVEGKRDGNLRTDAEFEDFNLTLEVNVGAEQNSGVYLRGVYEIQVEDSYGKPIGPHNMGSLYGRVAPSESAEKKPGEWQTMDITLVDRHVTVILNGKTIIDNAAVVGVTGGAMQPNGLLPGPIYLQGDHGSVSYRNMVLRPVVSKG